MATTYTVTNTFTADTAAVASQVNQNFTDILAALNAFDASNLSSGTVPLARIAGLTTTQFAANVIDVDGTLAANSDTRIASQKAAKTYSDAAPAAQMTPTAYAGGESVTYANGFIQKQGSSSFSGGSKTIVFAVAFPTDIVSLSGIIQNATSGQQMTYSAASASQITFKGSADIIFRWNAVGY